MSTISKSIRNFGLKGLLIYLQIKTGNVNTLNIPGLRNEIHLRKKTDDTKLFKQLMIHQEYEFPSPIEPEFIIDAGANIGLSSVFFAQKFPSATIIAIEAQKDNYALLSANTRNYPNISCVNAGLWYKSATLEVTDTAVGTTGFMVNETSPDNPAGFKALSTEDIMKMNNRSSIDLFKIDIEGAEKEVLSGNPGWLSKTKVIIIELHDRKKAGCSQTFFNAFSNTNFECHPFGQNFLLFNRDMI